MCNWGSRVVCLLFCALALSGRADQGWEGQIISLTAENDAVSKSDRHYTQGARLSYLSADDGLPGWSEVLSKSLPALGYSLSAQKFGIAVGQEVYTPEDLQTTVLQVEDRPYVGWLYGRFTLQRRGPVSDRWAVMEGFHLDLGVIGPESQANDLQKVWHGQDPQGWQHQLKTEPGINFHYERRYHFSLAGESTGWVVRLIPHLGGSAGNIQTLLRGGGSIRAGYNIPNEFATGGPREYRFGGYLHTGVDGRFVLHNIFLDGNTWRDSHRVTKRPFVGDFMTGFVAVLKRVELGITYVFRSREFNDQESSDSFGSATVTVKF
jgi:lipid A 3-O-deacylase